VAPLHKAGKLRVIAYTDRERDALLPDVPTVAESGVGLNDFEAGYWFAMFGQGALPADIIARLNTAMLALTKDAEFVSKAGTFGMRVYSMNAAESRARVLSTVKLIEQAVAAGIKLR
jgi:tripartite-type tricarboxylate transporter receptor subunit TctC